MKIGSHVSISKGLLGAVEESLSYGANTFMVYTGAPQNTRRSSLDKMKIPEAHQVMAENGIDEFVVHAPYIVNMASYKEDLFDLAKTFLRTEIERTEQMGSKYLVMHPGSYTDRDVQYGISRIAEGLNEVLDKPTAVTVLLETMAGKGSEIGSTFEELQSIIEKIEKKEHIGICFDTCHTHDAGYDIIGDLDGVLENFNQIIGLDLLKVVHINGSLNARGAKKDRHANIGATSENPKGEDQIGFDAIDRIVHHPKLSEKLFILETPWLDSKTNLYKEEIEKLRGA